MTITVANTSNTSTFSFWVSRTNELADAMSTKAVTVNSNTAAGNASITGTFSANSIVVGNNTLSVSIAAPNTAQISDGGYYLNANGVWAFVDTSEATDLIINNTLTVLGDTTANSVLYNGGVVAGSTLLVNGAATVNNTLEVLGATTLDSALTANAATFKGATVANTTLTVNGATTANAATFKGAVVANTTLTVNGATTANAATFRGAVIANTTLTVNGATTANAATFKGAVVANTTMTINGATTANAATFTGVVVANSTLNVTGTTTLGSTLTVSGTVLIPDRVSHIDDTDTYIQFNANDSFRIVTGASQRLLANNTGITCGVDVNAPNFNSTSDLKLKENIENISNGLDIINQIQTYKFNWKENKETSYGVIAQEIEKILPELVVESQETKYVNYTPLIAILIQAVKELSEKIDTK